MTEIKKGRPKLDISEAIRRKLWCSEVLRRARECGISTYEMDVKFDIRFGQFTSKNKKVDKRRRKIFEELEAKNIMPFRGMVDTFITRVDSYRTKDKKAIFKGTAYLYNSYLWSLFNPKPMSPTALRIFIVEMLESFGALNINGYPPEFMSPKDTIFDSKVKDISAFTAVIDQLQAITYLIPNSLDKLAFIGAVFREAYIGGNLQYATYFEGVFINQVEEICESTIIPEKFKDDFRDVCYQRRLPRYVTPELGYIEILAKYEVDESAAAYEFLIDQEWMW